MTIDRTYRQILIAASSHNLIDAIDLNEMIEETGFDKRAICQKILTVAFSQGANSAEHEEVSAIYNKYLKWAA